jgi:alkaline phosphatase D
MNHLIRQLPVPIRAAAILLLLLASLRAEEADPALLTRIAFGSCANHNAAQPIWDAVLAAKPDLFIFAGDNIYADTKDMQVMREKYAMLGAKPGYQKLLETTPVLATWDDHDYGVNDGGATYPKREESAQIMLDFFGVPADSVRRKRLGVYGARVYGPQGRRVQVILLDTRTFKSPQRKSTLTAAEKKHANLVGWYVPNNDPDSTILGTDQWAWLAEQLRQPAEWRLVVSSIQVVADEKGMESWGNFPHERKRLDDLIATTAATGVLFLSGDVHFSEVSLSRGGPYPLYDFTSSGLTNSSKAWAAAVNSHRVSDRAYAEPTFGLIEFDWNSPDPTVSLQARGLANQSAFEVKIPLASLRTSKRN